MNFDLKIALLKNFGSQVMAARQMGIRESRLSYIIHGHVLPTERERKEEEEEREEAEFFDCVMSIIMEEEE